MTDPQLDATVDAMLAIIKDHKFKIEEGISMRYLIADLPKHEDAKIHRIEEATSLLIKDGTLTRKGQTFYLTEVGFERVYK